MSLKKWFWGLFFLLGGSLIIVNQFGYLGDIHLLTLVFSILLVAIMIKSIPGLHFEGILFPIAVLLILFKEPLGISALNPWAILLTALFASIGLSIIFHSYRKHYDFSKQGEHFKTVVNEIDKEAIDVSVHFSSSIKYVNCDDFQKGSFHCSFGALKIYFDNAILNKNGAEITIDASFSGVELYIPKTWNIVNQINNSLSGVEEKNRNMPDKKSPQVILKGNIEFSGVEIIYI